MMIQPPGCAIVSIVLPRKKGKKLSENLSQRAVNRTNFDLDFRSPELAGIACNSIPETQSGEITIETPLCAKISRIQGGVFYRFSADPRFLASGTCFGAVLPLEITVLKVQKPKFFWPPKAAENFADL